MKINANAKINLSLDVCGKRSDGYHDVEMVMQEITFCDSLDVALTESEGITLDCASDLGDPKSTLTYKAAERFFDRTGYGGGCSITLCQNIPMCSGLGGGSADAAAVLNALNILCGNILSADELCRIGLELGADVPFCIMGGTCLAEGIGEILTPLKTKMKKWVALIKPDTDISTPEAYRLMDAEQYPHPDTPAVIRALENDDMNLFSESTLNCFEYVMKKKHPEIEEIKEHFCKSGSVFSMMSGSGPTVFGLFESRDAAQRAVDSYNKPTSGSGVGEFVLR